jgi:hypothetical protein
MKTNLPAIVLSPGWILYDEKHQKSIYYQDLINIIKENPNTSYYKMPVKYRVTLHRAVEELNDISQIGEMYDTHNTIDLTEIRVRQDRTFHKFPMSGKELISGKIYDSEPLKIS